MTNPTKLDDATARELAVAASCDPRTIKRVAAGLPVRGLPGHRAAAALRAAGFDLPEHQRAEPAPVTVATGGGQ